MDAAVTAGPTVLFLCTGNAARSVMAGAALAARLPHVSVETAGTLAIEGLPMSMRTRDALTGVGLAAGGHRSRQVTAAQLDRAALVVALAPEHVRWVRRQHPTAAARTATLHRLVRDLPAGGPLPALVEAMDLAAVELGEWEEVTDPAGGDLDVFVACAHQVVALVGALAERLSDGIAPPTS